MLGGDEPQVAVRGGQVLALRLSRAGKPAAGRPWLDPGKTVLVTGGTGGAGVLFAWHLASRHGARRLVLASRGGVAAGQVAGLAAELAGLGADVRVAACDVADRGQLAGLVGSLEYPLGVVVHAAGVTDDGTVESLTGGQLERVLRPKVDAASTLGRADGGPGPVGVRAVLLGGRADPAPRGRVITRRRTRSWTRWPPGGTLRGPARHVAGVGAVGGGHRDHRHPGRGGADPAGPDRHRRAAHRCGPGPVRPGAVPGPAAARPRPARPPGPARPGTRGPAPGPVRPAAVGAAGGCWWRFAGAAAGWCAAVAVGADHAGPGAGAGGWRAGSCLG